jgi:thiamine-monophosphate kinase
MRGRSCIDLSDGLSTDLRHLCEASNCGAEIWEASLPIAPGATLEQALNGGEDYELLFTAQDDEERVPDEIAGVRVTKIGTITGKGDGIRMLTKDLAWVDLPRGGWEHFRR